MFISTDVARMTYPDANGDFSDLEHPGDAMGTLESCFKTDRPVATGKQGASEDETVTPALGAGQQFGQPIGFMTLQSSTGGETLMKWGLRSHLGTPTLPSARAMDNT